MEYVSLFFDTPGFGGVVAGTVIATCLISYGLTVVWIMKGYTKEAEEE